MRKLRSLEALRIIAALLVVLFHTQSIFLNHLGLMPFDGCFSSGFRGVDLFFVLSGFIIAHIHAADLGRPSRLGNYTFNRIARIYPAVWIMTLLASVLYMGGFGGHEKAEKLTEWGFAASALLLPQIGDALVNVTWTLKYEVFFYLVFAVMIVNRKVGIALLAGWQLAVLAVTVFVSPRASGLPGFYFQSICLEFSLGLACAVLLARPGFVRAMRPAAVQWSLLGAGIAAFVAGMAANKHAFWTGVPCAVGSAAIITSLILLERSLRLKVPAILVVLGEASYSIYLVHFSVITLFVVLVMHLHIVPMNNFVFLSAAIAGVIGGVVFHLLVDRPIQRTLRIKFKPILIGNRKDKATA